MIQHPVDPPTHPNNDEGRTFIYVISKDLTHYEFLGEYENETDYVTMSEVGGSRITSGRVAGATILWWYPGPKCSVDGLPYPPIDPPPYEGLELVEDDDYYPDPDDDDTGNPESN